jgi:hypothetical protein
MTASEVEQWALRELRRPVLQESDRVEFKSKVIEPFRLARQIAGHANAARGEWILWIFGVDDKLGLVGILGLEWAKLWPQITSFFDGNPPNPIIVSFPEGGKSVTAVAFETTLPPYVVKDPSHDRLEVPWREGTRTRSAKHSDLLLLLGPVSSVLEVEVVAVRTLHVLGAPIGHQLEAELYFTPKSKYHVVIPLHRIETWLLINDIDVSAEVAALQGVQTLGLASFSFDLLSRAGSNSQAICDNHQIVLDAPAMIRLTTTVVVPASHPTLQSMKNHSVTLVLRCPINFEPLPLGITIRFNI